jgi:hypothetical protein
MDHGVTTATFFFSFVRSFGEHERTWCTYPVLKSETPEKAEKKKKKERHTALLTKGEKTELHNGAEYTWGATWRE